MTIAHDRAAGAPIFIEFRPAMRRLIEDTVESLLLLLDEIDGDADIEEDDPPEDAGDAEASLGAPEVGYLRSQTRWAQGRGDDLEDEHDGREPDVDDEPSLGSASIQNQDAWAIGADDDRELDEAERSGCGDHDGVIEQHGFGVEFAE
jgi:hypothetical protein